MFVRKNVPVGLLLSVVLLAATQLSFQVPGQYPQNKVPDRITGVVINSVTHEPVARALVVSEGETFATMTDSSGRFEIVFADTSADQTTSGPARPAMGSINRGYRPAMLTARKPGFLTGQNGPMSAGQQVTYGKDMEIALVPEALIVGHVALPTSEPPDPIEVELYRREIRNGRGHWVSAGVKSTRSDGEFRFAELPAGSYKLVTHEQRDEDPKLSAPGGQAYGYAPVYYPNASGFSSSGTITLTPGKIAEANLRLARQPYFPVIIPVTNIPSGNNFGGLAVSVEGPGGPGYSLEYDFQKQAITGLLPNGNYHVEAMTFSQQSFAGEANITVHGGSQGMLLPLAATPPINVNVKDQFTAEVSPMTSTTVDNNGRTSSRQLRFSVNLSLEAADDFGGQQQNGSLNGNLDSQNTSTQVERVLPGRYWVQVSASNGYVASVTAGGVDLLHHPLVVPFGSSAPAIDIVLRNDSATVEGMVEGASSLTGPAAPISLGGFGWGGPTGRESSARAYFIPLPDSPGRFAETFVNHDGTFSLSLPPGDYRVLVFPEVQPGLEYENPQAMRAYDGKGQVVRLAGGQKEKLQLQLVSPSE